MAILNPYEHTTPRKASAVLALVKARVSYRTIRSQEHVSLATIARIQKRAQEHPEAPTAVRPRSGRPIKLSARNQRAMIRDAISNRQITAYELASRYGCSTDTVQSTLRASKYHKCIQRNKPFLNKAHRAARLKFALEHRYWTEKDWNNVMFTNECNIEIDLDSRVVRVWRRPGEEFIDDCVKPTFKSG